MTILDNIAETCRQIDAARVAHETDGVETESITEQTTGTSADVDTSADNPANNEKGENECPQ